MSIIQIGSKTFSELHGVYWVNTDIFRGGEGGLWWCGCHKPLRSLQAAQIREAKDKQPFRLPTAGIGHPGQPLRPVLLMDRGCCNNIPIDRVAVDQVPRIDIRLASKASPLGPGNYSLLDIAPSGLDRNMSQATRQRLFDDGYKEALATVQTSAQCL